MIGIVGFSQKTNILLKLGILVNIFVQFIFCYVVDSGMAQASFDQDSIDAVRHWRGVVGHDIAHSDAVTKTSLVARLCNQDMSLHSSAHQFNVNADLQEFLGGDGGLSGQILCIICLLVWVWTIMQDQMDSFSFMEAVLAQDHCGADHPYIDANDDGEIIMCTGRSQRCRVVVWSAIPRFFMTLYLWYTGTRFLAYTEGLLDSC